MARPELPRDRAGHRRSASVLAAVLRRDLAAPRAHADRHRPRVLDRMAGAPCAVLTGLLHAGRGCRAVLELRRPGLAEPVSVHLPAGSPMKLSLHDPVVKRFVLPWAA